MTKIFFLIIQLLLIIGIEGINIKNIIQKVENLALKNTEIQDFIIQKGIYKNFNTSRCEYMDNCFFQNPHAPYSYINLPKNLDEKDHLKNPEENSEAFETTGDLKATWRINMDEAVVVIGKTPPKMKYFGVNAYITYKYVKGWFKNYWTTVFGSLGDAINHIRIQDQLQEDPFDQDVAFIMTGSNYTDQSIRNLLTNLGLEEKRIFTLRIPVRDNEIGYQVCLEDECDLYSMLFRVSYPEDPEKLKQYSESNPYTAFRISLKEIGGGYFEKNPLIPRKKENHTYMETFPEFKKQFNELISIIKEKIKKFGLHSSLFNRPSVAPFKHFKIDYGRDCYAQNLWCLGDNRDCVYTTPIGLPTLPFKNNSAIITVGVNHNKTNTVGFTNISIYNLLGRVGIIGIGDDEFIGSANYWVKNTTLESVGDFFYVIIWTRNCNIIRKTLRDENIFCIQVPHENYPSLKANDRTMFIERSYLGPNGVGPDPDTIISPRIILTSNHLIL